MIEAALRLHGTPACTGLARGPLHILDSDPTQGGAPMSAPSRPDSAQPHDTNRESQSLRRALTEASAGLVELRGATSANDARSIVEFQLAMLDDEVLSAPAFALIEHGVQAVAAWRIAMNAHLEDYATGGEYFRARAADVRDLRDRVLRGLSGVALANVPSGSIVVADDLPPSRFLEIPWVGGGIALFEGSATSHVAMLARARGIPMIVDVARAHLGSPGDALLDAENGVLIVSPDAESVARFERRQRARATARARDRTYLEAPAFTSTGERVLVQLNVAERGELDSIEPEHCDGIGLVRTEFTLRTLTALRDEQRQYARYAEIVRWAKGRPVTFRTLDAGADKPIAGYTLEAETNAYLGVRGVRLSLLHPDILATQLRALARAAALGPVKIMVPMVTQPFELEAVRVSLDTSVRALRDAGIACGNPQLGMMVEVPAAALTLDLFDADFFSIGSNDLIPFLTASRRDRDRLPTLTDPLQPAVLRIVAAIVAQARSRDVEVSLCGDMASEGRYLPAILHAGVRTISVAPAALAGVKATLARLRASAGG